MSITVREFTQAAGIYNQVRSPWPAGVIVPNILERLQTASSNDLVLNILVEHAGEPLRDIIENWLNASVGLTRSELRSNASSFSGRQTTEDFLEFASNPRYFPIIANLDEANPQLNSIDIQAAILRNTGLYSSHLSWQDVRLWADLDGDPDTLSDLDKQKIIDAADVYWQQTGGITS